MYLVKPFPGTRGRGRYTMYLPLRPKESVGRKGQIHRVSTRPLVPREGLYQIHGQSLNTPRGKHRSGGAQIWSDRFAPSMVNLTRKKAWKKVWWQFRQSSSKKSNPESRVGVGRHTRNLLVGYFGATFPESPKPSFRLSSLEWDSIPGLRGLAGGLSDFKCVPKTPDPITSAKTSGYKWEPYRDAH